MERGVLLARAKEEIARRIRRSRDELLTTVQALVRIPSGNSPPGGREKEAQLFLDRALEGADIPHRLVDLDGVSGLTAHEAYLPGRDYRDRPNLMATYAGSRGGRSLLLTGHIDTVPVGDDPWMHEPLGGQIEDGRLYGRGAYDMKGGIGAMLLALKTIAAAGVELAGDLLFETVVDEENGGCNGTLANRLIGHNAAAAILPEPSQLEVYPAHRGFRVAHCVIQGSSGMAFAGERLENPVEHIGRLIDAFKEFRNLRRARAPIPAVYASDPDPVPVFMPKLQAGEFSYRLPMAIPRTCKLEVYWQTMPGEERDGVERQFLDFLKHWASADPFFSVHPPEVEFSHRWMPGTQTDSRHPIVEAVRRAVAETTGTEASVRGAPYPCDLFMLNLYGRMPSVVLGPGGGNAHGADEFVLVEDLAKLAEILASAALEWCGVV